MRSISTPNLGHSTQAARRNRRLVALAAALISASLSMASSAQATEASSPAPAPTAPAGTALPLSADASAACVATIPLIDPFLTATESVRGIGDSSTLDEAKTRVTTLMNATKALAVTSSAAVAKVGAANVGPAAEQAAIYGKRAAEIATQIDGVIADIGAATSFDDIVTVFDKLAPTSDESSLNVNTDEFTDLRFALEGSKECLDLHLAMTRMSVENACRSAARDALRVTDAQQRLQNIADTAPIDEPRGVLLEMLRAGVEMNSEASRAMTSVRSLALGRTNPQPEVASQAHQYITAESTISGDLNAAIEAVTAATTADEIRAALNAPDLADNGNALDLTQPEYADLAKVLKELQGCQSLIDAQAKVS